MLKTALTAALAYSAIVFAAGFALGTLRVLVVAPRLGAPLAVLLEAPIMLAISWFACAFCIRRLPPGAASNLAMGATALVLLQAAELVLAVVAFGRTPADYVHNLGTLAGAEGLAAQLIFALFPAIQARSRG
jgi:hypothetical protein